MIRRTLTSILISILIKASISHRCASFSNVTVTVYPKGGQPREEQVSGCIQASSFKDRVIKVHIKNQNISRLGPDSIKTVRHLSNAIFEKNNIEIIEPSAFRNLPDLKLLSISFEKVRVLPEGIFSLLPTLQILKLDHNKIERIDDVAFGNVEALQKLYCNHNDIREWKNTWFTNSTKLRVLDFNHNQIKILPRGAFNGLSDLKEIYFDDNELDVIESTAFNGLRTLDHVGLKYNRLKTIHPRAFPNGMSIRSLALNANYLSFLPKKMMVAVTVEKMSLDGNPWKCPCLDQIFFWLHDTNATLLQWQSCQGENIPVCSFPSAYSRACREVFEQEVITTYLDELKRIDPPLEKHCARLD